MRGRALVTMIERASDRKGDREKGGGGERKRAIETREWGQERS